MKCPSCGSSNAKTKTFCGDCRERLRPVDPRLRQDVLAVLKEERKKWKIAGTVALTILGYFGIRTYQDLKAHAVTTATTLHQRFLDETKREATKAFRETLASETQKAVAEIRAAGVAQAHARELQEIRASQIGELRSLAKRERERLRDDAEEVIRQAVADATNRPSYSDAFRLAGSVNSLIDTPTGFTAGATLKYTGMTVTLGSTEGRASPLGVGSQDFQLPRLTAYQGLDADRASNELLRIPPSAFEPSAIGQTVDSWRSQNCANGVLKDVQSILCATANGSEPIQLPVSTNTELKGLVGVGSKIQ